MGYKKQAAKKNKEKKKERPVVVRSHTGIKYDGVRTDVESSLKNTTAKKRFLNMRVKRLKFRRNEILDLLSEIVPQI